jgi:very-short-patch-repair endonuclease
MREQSSLGVSMSIARSLRRRSTEPEKRLWHSLRDRQLDGWKFRRQVPVDRFVVDFLCHDAKLIIELDGGPHAENIRADLARTEILENCGYRVARYWNSEILQNFENVLEDILAHLNRRK